MAKNVDEIMLKRVKICLGLFIFFTLIVVSRLGFWMIVKGDKYSLEAKENQYREALIMPTRGIIYDTNGKELAVSIPKYDFWIELKNIKTEEAKQKIIEKISSVLKVDTEKLKKDLNLKKDRIILLNNLSLDDVKKLKEKKISNTWFDEKTSRYYPYGNFASYVLGHTSANNVGLAGIEAYMDLQLKGIPGKRLYVRDALGGEISLRDIKYQEQIPGKNVMLTIDEVIQHNLEKVLHNAYYTYTPKSVTGIVMETKTGNILAMSTIPDYNPNLPREPAYDYYAKLMQEAVDEDEKMKVVYDMWKNPSVNVVFEPGSPFKLITAATALEEDKSNMEEYFNDTGSIEVAGVKLKNWTPTPYGIITLKKGLENSVNTVFVQLGQRIGAKLFMEYIDTFGFGKKTNIDLPGEESGVVRKVENIGPVELANLSYGQGISVTPIQLITAINAIGNGGNLVEPNIVKAITDKDGNIISKSETKTLKQVISSQTASSILYAMESIVDNGSGKKAKVEGYRIAGKTGSANKVIPGQIGYADNKYICTFAAIVPVEDPKITVLVVIDEPLEGTQSGSESAAPITGQILEGTLKYLGINQNIRINEENNQKTVAVPELKGKSYTEATNELRAIGLNPVFDPNIVVELESHVMSSFPQAGEMVEPNSSIMLYMRSDSTLKTNMPNLIGLTKEQAQVILDNLEIKYNFSGSGKVYNQSPKVGTPVDKDFRVNIELK
ncbi:hypothetical protein HMPREF9629_00335 [Peptoanaerobacter stomatis]|uniref:PASTA domain-containing protein n=1 Tax=Peptoanaerobacter stomatis TaxID=796937 RepID=G9X1R2_9FIRM|nr:penicillin-binding protein 2 [Peptoanaerobacter stomatis]EHL13035.1 hypothetical protein HMPREF9629_00335 [Peptoanaerobacter stomatis]